MKTSLEWLRQYLPGPLTAETAAHALTHGGLPVELIETVGDDTVIDVEVTSNRSDCLSVVGVARELAALLNREFTDVELATDLIGSGSASDTGLTAVGIDAPDLCPHYTARVIRGVKDRPQSAMDAAPPDRHRHSAHQQYCRCHQLCADGNGPAAACV